MFWFVSEVMSRCPCLVEEDLPVADVAAVMREEAVDTVVVGSAHRPVGVLTAADIVVQVTAVGVDPETVTAGDICADLRVTAAPDEELSSVLAKIEVHRRQVIPVIDDGEVIGLLALQDLGLAASHTLRRNGNIRMTTSGTDRSIPVDRPRGVGPVEARTGGGHIPGQGPWAATPPRLGQTLAGDVSRRAT